MDETTYKFLMGGSAFVIAILGGMLWTTIISPESGLDKLRKARNILVSSYFVLAFLSLICCFTGYDRHIEPASTLFVASFQALLFTVSMLVFIRPDAVRWSMVFRHAVAITVAGITLFVVLFCFTGSFMWFFYAGIIAYVVQLAFYTWKFMLAYHKTVQEVEDYYDDDEESRLYWVKIGFYSALAIGIMALSLLFYPGIYKFFVPLYVLFYSFIVMWFVNYYHKMKFAIPVIVADSLNRQVMAGESEPDSGNMEIEAREDIGEGNGKELMAEDILTEKEQILHERLQQYIERKEYCRRDIPSEEVAASLGTTKPFLRRYMSKRHGIWFSTWRNDLRIHEACLLYQKNPAISITDMTRKIGYANSGNFCRDFKKTVGVTPREYGMQIRLKGE